MSIILDGAAFYAKVENIRQELIANNELDSLVVVMGKPSEEENERPHSTDFFLWLLNYEFRDTVFAVTENKLVFLVSPKKAKCLKTMDIPEGYCGPAVELIEYDLKTGNLGEYISQLFNSAPLGKKTGYFSADKEDSKLT